MNTLTVYRLGRVEYEDGLKLMHLFGEARRQGLVRDVLLLLEHPPVLTLGRAAKRENIVAADAAPRRRGRGGLRDQPRRRRHLPRARTARGLPHLPPAPERQDVRRYVRDVERGVIQALAGFGLTAGPIPKWPGVWIGEEGSPDARKIAAIGVHLSRWLTTHGFALNVNTRLEHFQLIVPCGIREAGVTSMQRELGRAVPVPEVEEALAESFSEVFDAQRVDAAPPHAHGERRGGARPGPGGPRAARAPHAGARRLLADRHRPPGARRVPRARPPPASCGGDGPAHRRPWTWTTATPSPLGEALPPRLVEENGFAVHCAPDAEVHLGPEHDAFEWVDVPTALQRLPFRGLRETVERALRSGAEPATTA